MIELSDNTILDFENVIDFDLTTYINDYINFINIDLQKFVDFYKGISILNITSKNNFNSLLQRSIDLSNILQQQLFYFTRCDFANLIEIIDNIRFDLKKINNLSKYLKSSIISINYTLNVAIDKVVSNFETMEIIHNDKPNNQNTWVDTAIKNRIYESNFDETNGYTIKLEKSNITNFDISNVIDNLIGENLYGKDIKKTIEFTNDYSDLVTLNGKDTFQQALEITTNLQQNDNPFYPFAGVDPSLLFGNMIGINIPFIISDLTNTFLLDQTIQNFSVDDINVDINALYLSISAKSYYNTTFSTNLSLQSS